jgi:hypothetical protein
MLLRACEHVPAWRRRARSSIVENVPCTCGPRYSAVRIYPEQAADGERPRNQTTPHILLIARCIKSTCTLLQAKIDHRRCDAACRPKLTSQGQRNRHHCLSLDVLQVTVGGKHPRQTAIDRENRLYISPVQLEQRRQEASRHRPLCDVIALETRASAGAKGSGQGDEDTGGVTVERVAQLQYWGRTKKKGKDAALAYILFSINQEHVCTCTILAATRPLIIITGKK